MLDTPDTRGLQRIAAPDGGPAEELTDATTRPRA